MNRSGGRSLSRRERTVILMLSIFVVITGVAFALHRAARVDNGEFAVLEALIAEAIPDSDFSVASVERSEAAPCWWWCEDYQLYVELTALVTSRSDGGRQQLCDRIAGSVSAVVGFDPDTDVGSLRGRTCVMSWWPVMYDGREVGVSVHVSDDRGDPAEIRVRNLSEERAFLPWGAVAVGGTGKQTAARH